MCDKIAISAHSLKMVENDPFLRLQMTANEGLLLPWQQIYHFASLFNF